MSISSAASAFSSWSAWSASPTLRRWSWPGIHWSAQRWLIRASSSSHTFTERETSSIYINKSLESLEFHFHTISLMFRAPGWPFTWGKKIKEEHLSIQGYFGLSWLNSNKIIWSQKWYYCFSFSPFHWPDSVSACYVPPRSPVSKYRWNIREFKNQQINNASLRSPWNRYIDYKSTNFYNWQWFNVSKLAKSSQQYNFLQEPHPLSNSLPVFPCSWAHRCLPKAMESVESSER